MVACSVMIFKSSLRVRLSTFVAPRRVRRGVAARSEVGLFYSTSTGNTECAAEWVQDKFGDGITAPMDMGETKVEDLKKYDALIVGAPTWNTGSDEQRTGTAWDDTFDEVKNLDLSGKKVAVFGCGDSAAYSEYFCDGIEELHSAFKAAGATMVGEVSTDGYDYAESKSVVDGKFLGLPLDEDNEGDQTEARVEAWVEQLKAAGFA